MSLAAAYGCSIFSVIGIMFMSWVGVMLMKQPFLIAGIEDVEKAKGNAFGAAATFFFSFLACVVYQVKESRSQLPPIESPYQPARRMDNEYGEYSGGGYRDYPDEDSHAIQELPESMTRRIV